MSAYQHCTYTLKTKHLRNHYSRSGMRRKYGIVLGNLIGLIDSDYQGPHGILLEQRHRHSHFNQVIALPNWFFCQSFATAILLKTSPTPPPREGGFGSPASAQKICQALLNEILNTGAPAIRFQAL